MPAGGGGKIGKEKSSAEQKCVCCSKSQVERQNIPISPLCSLATNNPRKYLFQRSNYKRLQSKRKKKVKNETVSLRFILKIFQNMRNLAQATVTQVFTVGNELCKHIDLSISYIIIVKQRYVFLEDLLRRSADE